MPHSDRLRAQITQVNSISIKVLGSLLEFLSHELVGQVCPSKLAVLVHFYVPFFLGEGLHKWQEIGDRTIVILGVFP
jgi:hypothetical protein